MSVMLVVGLNPAVAVAAETGTPTRDGDAVPITSLEVTSDVVAPSYGAPVEAPSNIVTSSEHATCTATWYWSEDGTRWSRYTGDTYVAGVYKLEYFVTVGLPPTTVPGWTGGIPYPVTCNGEEVTERSNSGSDDNSYGFGFFAGRYVVEGPGPEVAVAVFDPSNGSLTFYNRPESEVSVPDGATVYDVPLDGSSVTWSTISHQVFSVSFVDRIGPVSTTGWFYGMSSCTSMDLANLDTSAVTDMGSMFEGCSALTSLDLSGFDTSNATTMSNMFNDCRSLTSLDLSSFNTAAVTDMRSMFQECPSLTDLDLSSFDTSSASVGGMAFMFYGCSSLSRIALGASFVFGFDTQFARTQDSWSWAKGSPYSAERYTSDELRQSYDGSTMAGTYYWSEDSTPVEPIAVAVYDPATGSLSVYNRPIDEVPIGDDSIVYNVPLDGADAPWTDVSNRVISVTIVDSVSPSSSIAGWFKDFVNCEMFDLDQLDTSDVVSMDWLFDGCASIVSLDLTGFDTSSVTSMRCMFQDCKNLDTIEIESFDLSSLNDADNMFYGCSSLSQITLGAGFAFRDYSCFDRAEEGWSWAKGSPSSSERYTSAELVSSYDGATMAGTYYWSEESSAGAVLEVDFTEPSYGASVGGHDVTATLGGNPINDPYNDTVQCARFDSARSGSSGPWADLSDSDAFCEGAYKYTFGFLVDSALLPDSEGELRAVVNGREATAHVQPYGDGKCRIVLEQTYVVTESSCVVSPLSGIAATSDIGRPVLGGAVADPSVSVLGDHVRLDEAESGWALLVNEPSGSVPPEYEAYTGDTFGSGIYAYRYVFDVDLSISTTGYGLDGVGDYPVFPVAVNCREAFGSRADGREARVVGGDESGYKVAFYSEPYADTGQGIESLEVTSDVTAPSYGAPVEAPSNIVTSSEHATCTATWFWSEDGTKWSRYTGDTYVAGVYKLEYFVTIGLPPTTVPGWTGGIPYPVTCNGEEVTERSNSGSGDYNYGFGFFSARYVVEEPGPEVAVAVFDPSDGSLTFYNRPRSEVPVPDGATVYDVPLDGDYSTVPWGYIADRVVCVSFADRMAPTSTSEWFWGMRSCKTMDLGNLDTSEVTDASYMFKGCESLSSLDLSSFETSSMIDMSNIFWGCSSLAALDLSSFDTSNVVDMGGMFMNCSSLSSLDLSSFDTSSVTSMGGMFSGCASLASLDLSSFDTSSVTNMAYMFSGCHSFAGFSDFDGLSAFDTSSVTNMTGMFDMGGNTSSSLVSVDLSEWDTSSVTSMDRLFNGCIRLSSVDLSSLDTSSVTTMSSMFGDCSSLDSLDLSSFDTSHVTDMSWMFYRCKQLTSLNLSGWNTSNVTDMQAMFITCSSLSKVDLSSFNTSNVTNMSGMFNSCASLEELDLSNFDTANVVDMSGMFMWCSALEELDLSSFNTSNVTNMHGVFARCSSLSSLDLKGFDTSNVTDLSAMFHGCSSLESLDISDFDTSKVADMSSMFAECPALSQIILSNRFAFGDAVCFDRAEEGWSWAKGSPDSTERYSSADLVSSYDGAAMAGAYYWSEDPSPEPIDIANAEVALNPATVVFTGKPAVWPAVTVSIGGKTLEAEKDYTVALLDGGTSNGTLPGTMVFGVSGVEANGYTGATTVTFEILPTGWYKVDGMWYYYDAEGHMVTNAWQKDSKGTCYLGPDGKAITSAWKKIAGKYYYFDSAAHMVTSKWVKDSKDWCYAGSDGAAVVNKWVKDSKGWCYIGSNTRIVRNAWQKDSKGMCYLDATGHAVASKWHKVDGRYYYFDSAAHMVTNKWVKDSKDWCYAGSDGAAVVNKWVKDSKGWCYIGSNTRIVRSAWQEDSKGTCYLDASGHAVTNSWMELAGAQYYFDSAAHMVTGTYSVNGKTYFFDSDGVWRPYIANVRSGVFHEATCGSATSMSSNNRREYYVSREEMIGMGYKPCGNCEP